MAAFVDIVKDGFGKILLKVREILKLKKGEKVERDHMIALMHADILIVACTTSRSYSTLREQSASVGDEQIVGTASGLFGMLQNGTLDGSKAPLQTVAVSEEVAGDGKIVRTDFIGKVVFACAVHSMFGKDDMEVQTRGWQA